MQTAQDQTLDRVEPDRALFSPIATIPDLMLRTTTTTAFFSVVVLFSLF
jgi:hypothetical protein